MDWFTVTNGVVLNTFAVLRYSVDSEKFDFNNKLEPGIGLKLKKSFSDWGLLELGVKYVNEFRFESGRSEDTGVLFLNWWVGWNLRGK